MPLGKMKNAHWRILVGISKLRGIEGLGLRVEEDEKTVERNSNLELFSCKHVPENSARYPDLPCGNANEENSHPEYHGVSKTSGDSATDWHPWSLGTAES